MSSTSDAPSPTSGGGDDNTELIIAVVALIISVLAFVIAILQALQQYYASATGFSSCSPAVIGKWSRFSRRRMRWSEFRFEVQFEHPVIFVARPENRKGPLGDDDLTTDEARKIIRLDGSPGNFEHYTSSMKEFDQQRLEEIKKQVVHTADNEKATWYALLMAICRMEKESREWQVNREAEWRKTNGPKPPCNSATTPEPPEKHHSLLVCMQRKRRTWDSMPQDLAKPYATTTISHLVEIAAMLGIYWRKFDLNDDQYRAQGNGFVLYGSYVDGLGITFTFQKQGPTWFEQNRVIPNYDVKKLCFGIAPTIFHREKQVYADEPKGLGSLQLGSLDETAQTLAVFGCDTNTVNYFRKNLEKVRHSHLFPIPFEILGMVGEMLHIKDTVFRMIPNPTVFYWDSTTFSLPTLMTEYITLLRSLREKEESIKDSEQVAEILEWVDSNKILPTRGSSSNLDAMADTINGATLINELTHLRAGVEICDKYFQRMSLKTVRKVMRVHIQEILSMLNEKDSSASAKKDDSEAVQDSPMTMNDIDSASADEKESLLAEVYFDSVRRNVVRVVCEQDTMSKQRRVRRASAAGENAANSGAKPSEGITQGQVNEVWCTLVFRMLCWLQLHDFHKKDIQVSKSDAYASRIPVYIV
ncbi:hypothetical protein ACJZ2D_007231 [Fusarium nematophilum]